MMKKMTYKDLFLEKKPIIGMVHLGGNDDMLSLAQKEIEIYLRHGVYPLIENYYGSTEDCETVLKWICATHPDAVYGINILGNYPEAFRLANDYSAKFIQIDSVCGHLEPEDDERYAEGLHFFRRNSDAIVLGGVRFKYQAVRSGRSVAEDLRIGMTRCDAIVCTGNGTGEATPFDKVDEFKAVLGDFPVVVGAGVTLEVINETMAKSDGAIVGTWFKYGHNTSNQVNEEFVKELIEQCRLG